MNDGRLARMLVELDAELAEQQNMDAACDLVANLGRALGFRVTRSPDNAAKMARILHEIEAVEPGMRTALGRMADAILRPKRSTSRQSGKH